MSLAIRTREPNHRRPHCHAAYPGQGNPEAEASVALDDFEVLANSGFDEADLSEIVLLVQRNRDLLMEKWNEIYGSEE